MGNKKEGMMQCADNLVLLDGRKNDFWRSSYKSDFEQRPKSRPQRDRQSSAPSSVVTATATSILAPYVALPGAGPASRVSAVEPSVVSCVGLFPTLDASRASRSTSR